jgi:hypothetical protein
MSCTIQTDSVSIQQKIISNDKKHLPIGQLAAIGQPVENCQRGRRSKFAKMSSEHRNFKLKERQERNRQAAKRSKESKKQFEQGLIAEIHRLEQENYRIENIVIQLKAKQQHLELDLFEISLSENNRHDTQLASSASNIIDMNDIPQQNFRSCNDTVRDFNCDVDSEFADFRYFSIDCSEDHMK